MRLDRLDLTRYGHFTDRVIDFRPPETGGPDLHIIYGPNETGKSTMFSAWMDLLFGIPGQTRNAFLHPGPTMQIGARLSDVNGASEVKRLKRNGPSLIDAHDATLPEAVIQSLLGGLSREGYGAMFCLDDDSLEKGGDSILANRGELGAMLFAASAGLSELAPQLDGIRNDLDAFHRQGKRSGWLHDAKKQLAELDKQRRDLDVSANALKRLSNEAEISEAAWREARARENALSQGLQCLRDEVAALPIHRKLAARLAELAPLDLLRSAGAREEAWFERVDRDRDAAIARRAKHALRLQSLTEKMQALSLDPDIRSCAGDILAADALRGDHDGAIRDLPHRKEELTRLEARLEDAATQLGLTKADAGALVPSAAAMAQLRALLASRSGKQEALLSARREAAKASERLERETQRLGDPGPAEEDGALNQLLNRLRLTDPVDALSTALRDRDAALSRLAGALDALQPWQGDAETLAALDVPPSWQTTEWGETGERLRQREADTRREIEDLRKAVLRQDEELAALSQANAVGFSLADATAARAKREALWAEHSASLTLTTAHAFEQALREDDHISSLLAEALASARQEAAGRAEQKNREARLQAAEDELAATHSAQTELTATIQSTCQALNLPGASLADLSAWLERRIAALAERLPLRTADAAVNRARDALTNAEASLRAVMADTETDTYDALLARAQARQNALEARREARRTLSGLAADLRERKQIEAEAQCDLGRWQEEWRSSCPALLAALPWDHDGFGPMLDLLDRIGEDSRNRSGLLDRIAKMEANRDRFIDAHAAIEAKLTDHASWDEILKRLRRAEQTARDQESLAEQIAQAQLEDADDQRQIQAAENEMQTLAAELAWAGEADSSLEQHLAACVKARQLREQVAELRNDLRDRPGLDADRDEEHLRAELSKLEEDQQIAREDSEARHAASLEARRNLDAVGGDDAVARVVSERENLALDMREQVRAHLASRFGLIAFEAALRRYRDKHRSTMLAAASEAFRSLSLGAYDSLAAQPDGQQEVLVALAAAGGAKTATEMSKGTRFQLYLALRIAGYHELARSRPTVPFIADDIMETFDDDRSSATFRLLGDMSRSGQVIYLTHHRHLCDLARAACPGVNVIGLQNA